MFILTALLLLLGQAQPQAQVDANQLAKLEGRVVHSVTGEPVRKAKLTLIKRSTDMMMSQGATPAGAITDDDGKFRFDKVEAGTYMLMAERSGFVRQQYGARGTAFMGTPLTVSAGGHLGDLLFKLLPQSVIAGRVIDDEGEPVQHASVSAMLQGSGGRAMGGMGAQTNDLGEFRLTDLAPGKYLVRATPGRGYFGGSPAPPAKEPGKRRQGLLPTYYPGVTDASAASPIELGPGQQLSGISVQLQKGFVYRITGKLSARSRPGQMTRVMLMPRQRSLAGVMGGGSGMVKPDSSFEIHEVQPGSYQVVAMENEMGGRPQPVARAPVDVTDQDVENVVLQAMTPVDISGTVRVDGDKQVSTAGMRLMLMPSEGFPFGNPNIMVTDDGTFQISSVTPDRYYLNFFGTPQGHYVRAARFGSEDALKGFQVVGGGKLEILLAAGAPTVQGAAQLDGKPYQGAMMLLAPEPFTQETSYLRRFGTSDQNGRYEFKDVAPGDYRVYAWQEPQLPMPTEAEELKPFDSKSVKLTVREGATEQVDIKIIEPPKQ